MTTRMRPDDAPGFELSRSRFEKYLRAGFGGTAEVLEVTPMSGGSAGRWGYALPGEREGQDCLWDGPLRVAACGDWCRGGRIEGAFLSGLAAAGRILGQSG